MLGLEPGDIARAIVILRLAKAQKGAHLVDVAPHRLGQSVEAADQRIGLILDQPGLAAQPVEGGVEQSETLRVVGQDDAARKVDKATRYVEAGAVVAGLASATAPNRSAGCSPTCHTT
ncbi:hypothetical protein GCM10020258_08680 [Sphingomonas yabuuchiae]